MNGALALVLLAGCATDGAITAVDTSQTTLDYSQEVALRSLRQSLAISEGWLRSTSGDSHERIRAFREGLQRDLSELTLSRANPSRKMRVANLEGEMLSGLFDTRPTETFTTADILNNRVLVATRLKISPITHIGIYGTISTATAVTIVPQNGTTITKVFASGTNLPVSVFGSASGDLANGRFSCRTSSGKMDAFTEHRVEGSWPFFPNTIDSHNTADSDQCIARGTATITGGPSSIVVATEAAILSSSNCSPANRVWSSSDTRVAWLGTNADKNAIVIGESEGEATITLDCAPQNLLNGTLQISVTSPNEPCDAGDGDGDGGGHAELRVGLSAAGGRQSLMIAGPLAGALGVTSSSVDCEPDQPGGGGGTPPPTTEPGEDCYWARDILIYSDGSWIWLSGWYRECRVAMSLMDVDNTANSILRISRRVKVIASDNLPTGRPILLYQTPGGETNVEVVVDTVNARATDLANAFHAVRMLLSSPMPPTHEAARGTILHSNGATSRNDSSPTLTYAASILNTLRSSPERQSRFGKRGRSIILRIGRYGITPPDAPPLPIEATRRRQ